MHLLSDMPNLHQEFQGPAVCDSFMVFLSPYKISLNILYEMGRFTLLSRTYMWTNNKIVNLRESSGLLHMPSPPFWYADSLLCSPHMFFSEIYGPETICYLERSSIQTINAQSEIYMPQQSGYIYQTTLPTGSTYQTYLFNVLLLSIIDYDIQWFILKLDKSIYKSTGMIYNVVRCIPASQLTPASS